MVVKRLMWLTLAVMVLIAPLSTAQVREFDFYSTAPGSGGSRVAPRLRRRRA